MFSQKVSDPFFIFDVGNLVHKIQLWREKLPRVKPYYSEFKYDFLHLGYDFVPI